MRVAFRVDGGSTIGMGHVMRCLSLAKELKKNGYILYFFSSLPQGVERIGQEGFETIFIPLENEANAIINKLKEYNIKCLIIDTYNVTEEYFLLLKAHVHILIYIDDLNKFIYPVDVLINGNITGEHLNYIEYRGNQKFLLGPKYNMIREEFKNLPPRVLRSEVQDIMITTGGSDPFHLSEKLIHMLHEDEQFRSFTLHIIVGNGFQNKEVLREMQYQYKNIQLYENVQYMSEVMLKCDIAISAGGSTLYELCACGTPTLAFILADNQEFIVQKMDELGYIKSFGWHHELEKDAFLNTLNGLAQDYSYRKLMSSKGQVLVDGKGVQRIVQCIKELEK